MSNLHTIQYSDPSIGTTDKLLNGDNIGKRDKARKEERYTGWGTPVKAEGKPPLGFVFDF